MAKRNNPIYDTDFLEGLWCSSSMPAGTYTKIVASLLPLEYGITRMDLYINDAYVGSDIYPWTRINSSGKIVFDLAAAGAAYQITQIPKVYYYDNTGNLVYVAHVKTEARVIQIPPVPCTLTTVASASPTTINPGATVTFTVTASTAGSCSGTTTFNWSFGDGQSSTLQNPTHVYNTSGSYPWTMTASNGSTTSIKTGTIIVNQATFTITGKISSLPLQFVSASYSGIVGAKPIINLLKLTTQNLWGLGYGKFPVTVNGISGYVATDSSGNYSIPNVPFIPNQTYYVTVDGMISGLTSTLGARFSNAQLTAMGACSPIVTGAGIGDANAGWPQWGYSYYDDETASYKNYISEISYDYSFYFLTQLAGQTSPPIPAMILAYRSPNFVSGPLVAVVGPYTTNPGTVAVPVPTYEARPFFDPNILIYNGYYSAGSTTGPYMSLLPFMSYSIALPFGCTLAGYNQVKTALVSDATPTHVLPDAFPTVNIT
jgi:PKD repeat protein